MESSAASAARREEIATAARDLYEEKGLAKTTVRDITERVGVSRSLFYHYFPDKEAVTSAVIDGYVDDFVESAEIWNEQRQEGDIEGSLASAIRLLRTNVFENNSLHKALTTHENAALYLEFISKAADRLAHYIAETTAQDYAARYDVEIDHVYETLYVLICGLVSYVRTHPDTDDATLMDLVAQTLHMRRGKQGESQAESPAEATPQLNE